MEKTNILTQTGQTLVGFDQAKVLLDLHVKKLLACKPILACILQETVSECSGMTPKEIADSIEGTPAIDKVPVFPGCELIDGRSEEDYLDGEGIVRYDIRTELKLSGGSSTEMVKILIDLEAQKDEKPGYDIPLRALFYCSRMISSQLGREFTNRTDDPVKYGNIKKVYSIFICSNTAELRSNSVDLYTINRNTIIGHNNDNPRYDIINAVIVNIGNRHEAKDSSSRMIRMLNNLLDTNMSAAQKLDALQDCGIEVTHEVESEVDHMCTYTASVLRKGHAEGRAEGRAEGHAEIIMKMLMNGKTPDQIVALTGVPKEEVVSVEEVMLQRI